MTELAATSFLTQADCDESSSLMARKYASYIRQRYFTTTVRKDSKGVYATITLRNASGSFFYPVEGRLANADHDMNERDAALFLLDYMDSYFQEYFKEGGEVYLPIDWADYEWDGIVLQLKGQILNLEVERMADALLEGQVTDGGESLLH